MTMDGFENKQETEEPNNNFRETLAAYKVLSDPELRMKYDKGILPKTEGSSCNSVNHFIQLLQETGLFEEFKGMSCRW